MLWDEVGDGCFRRRYQSFDLNIGVVRGSDALLVVDTRADLRQADELLDDLRAFGRPVRWVVNSHWHFDHGFGNQRFVERARGETRHGADVTADLQLWGHADVPAMLLDNEDELRASLRSRYGDAAGDEYDRVSLTPPDHLVTDSVVLDLGDRSVALSHLGRGHTGNDLVVSVPDVDVVFAGDLLEESAPPAYGDDSFPLLWPATADALVGTGASTFVPGHGDVMSASSAAQQAEAMTTVATLIRELHAAGISAADALDEAGDRWPFPVEALAVAVQRGYESLGRPPLPGTGRGALPGSPGEH
jgi:glyoxylase-like metal-dependent hydrolase (beta-lactamase superfamily II)